jgi:hypothetical protein
MTDKTKAVNKLMKDHKQTLLQRRKQEQSASFTDDQMDRLARLLDELVNDNQWTCDEKVAQICAEMTKRDADVALTEFSAWFWDEDLEGGN